MRDKKGDNVMTYFMILFVSPLYFMTRGQWGGFVVNLTLYVIAWLTLLVFGIGVIFWALGVGHAGWAYRTEMMQEQATMIAKAMVEQQRKQ